MSKLSNFLPGITLALLVTVISHQLVPFVQIGAPMLALLTGMVFSSIYLSKQSKLRMGVSFSQTKALEAAIVLLGFSISIDNYSSYTAYFISIPFVVATSLGFTYIVSRKLGVSKKQSVLLSFGNSICGSAAVATASKVIEADAKDVGSVLPVINILGVILLFIFPLAFAAFPYLSKDQSLFVLGSSLQSVGHVGALGGSFAPELAIVALSFKMWRVLLLFPSSLALQKIYQRKSNSASSSASNYYLWLFFAAILLTNFLHFDFYKYFVDSGKFLLTFAMGAIGLGISFKSAFKNSPKLMLAGTISIVFIITANTLISVFFGH